MEGFPPRSSPVGGQPWNSKVRQVANSWYLQTMNSDRDPHRLHAMDWQRHYDFEVVVRKATDSKLQSVATAINVSAAVAVVDDLLQGLVRAGDVQYSLGGTARSSQSYRGGWRPGESDLQLRARPHPVAGKAAWVHAARFSQAARAVQRSPMRTNRRDRSR
jgi:hypothetical protein